MHGIPSTACCAGRAQGAQCWRPQGKAKALHYTRCTLASVGLAAHVGEWPPLVEPLDDDEKVVDPNQVADLPSSGPEAWRGTYVAPPPSYGRSRRGRGHRHHKVLHHAHRYGPHRRPPGLGAAVGYGGAFQSRTPDKTSYEREKPRGRNMTQRRWSADKYTRAAEQQARQMARRDGNGYGKR